MPEPIIRFQNLTKTYNNSPILDKINLDINSGEIFGVIGASGSGKTTLLTTLIGFIPIDSGDIFFNQKILVNKSLKESFKSIFSRQKTIKKLFGFASQSPSFYSKLTVYENLDYFGDLHDLTSEERKINIDTLLNLMELKSKQDNLASDLSGGMQRRLDIACALMHDPKVLILDEPTADLDPFLRKHILKLIKKINKKGTTIILSSHNLEELETLCTRIGIIYKHNFLAVGTPDQVKDRFSKDEKIHIETYPGNYDELIKKLKDKSIEEIENRGTELVISTTTPELVLHKVLHAIEGSKESLIDVKISKPSLDEVFMSLAKTSREEMHAEVEKVTEKPHHETHHDEKKHEKDEKKSTVEEKVTEEQKKEDISGNKASEHAQESKKIIDKKESAAETK